MSGQIQTLATPPPVSVQTLLYNIYLAAASGGSGGASWGSITGTLSAQADLQTALNAKLPLTGGTLTPAANTTALTLGGSLTGSNAQSTLSLSPTWNTTGAPALIYGRVTNTASGSSAKLIDLGTVAGGSLFAVRKDGTVDTQVVNGGSYINLNVANTNKFGIGGSFNFTYQPITFSATYARFDSMAAPGNATAGSVNLYCDNSGGKMRLMVIGPTGAAVALYTEP